MKLRGRVRNGKVELPEGVRLPEGMEVEFTAMSRDEWMRRAEELRRRVGGLGVDIVELIRRGRR